MMFETIRKQSVRLNLLYSGLSPPIFIPSNMTNPQRDPYEINNTEERVIDNRNSNCPSGTHVRGDLKSVLVRP